MPEIALAALALLVIFALASLLLIVHELGHYLAARACRCPVGLVTVGIGPKLIERTDGAGTTWRLSLVPLGGFVAMRPDPALSGPATFQARPIVSRLLVTAAGPVANILLAIAVYAGLAAVLGSSSFLPIASSIEPGSPAKAAGFHAADLITAADAVPVAHFEDLKPILERHPCQAVRFDVTRAGSRLILTATLAARIQDGRTIGHLGIWSHDLTTRQVGIREALELGVQRTWNGTVATAREMAQAIGHGRQPNLLSVAGNTADLKGKNALPELPMLLALAALLSVGLAASNLLPLPILDGGAILVALAELVRRKPASPAALAFANRAGAAVIMALCAFASLRDALFR